MKKFALIMMVAIFAAVTMFGFTIMDNTLVSNGIYPQSVSADAYATTSAISLKGYERCHILMPYKSVTGSADVSVTLRFLQAATSGAAYTVVDTVTAVATPLTYGVLELEAVKNFSYPYIKADITAAGSATVAGVTIVFYGAEDRPF